MKTNLSAPKRSSLMLALLLLASGCGGGATLNPGTYEIGQYPEAWSGARVVVDADLNTFSLTLGGEQPVSGTLELLPSEEWEELGTYAFSRGPAETHRISPDPLVIGTRSIQRPRLVAASEMVVLFGDTGVGGPELPVYFESIAAQ